MPPTPSECFSLLKALNLGNSVAEHDNVLFEARVETPAFGQLVRDEIDLVRGTKGSGKTALFRIFTGPLRDWIWAKMATIIIDGVEPRGDPVFAVFRNRFSILDELDFQDFWRIYLMALSARHPLSDGRFAKAVNDHPGEWRQFISSCQSAGIPVATHKVGLAEIVNAVLEVCGRIKLSQTYDTNAGTVKTGIEYVPSSPVAPARQRTPVFISEVQKCLAAFLKAAGIRIWLMLDRLDEVFPRRTNMEKVALRALLQTTKSFASPRVRLKVFLRDDILEYITEKDGFTGLTHVTARATQTLTWTKADLVHLIVSRVFASDAVAKCFAVDKKRLTTDEAYRYECFLKVFPQQVERGQKRSSTLDWLISHCQDGKGVVTPRDIIDLLLNARSNQLETEQRDPHEHEFLIGPAALKYGHVELSKRKRESYLLAEFPHFAEDILKLQGSKSEHNLDSLRALYGNRTDDVVKNLYAIGLLQRRTSDTYSIPFLFRPGLELRQGKAYRTGVRH